jgi:molybdopterin-guanine dinucleotide biosynthesis protein A
MGSNKALLDLAGRPMIEIVAERLRVVADEILIAGDDTQLYLSFADRCVPDRFPGVGVLGGIHAGLEAARHELAVVVGCDMPFLKPAVLEWFAMVAVDSDVVVLRDGEWVEPLHAVYRRTCLPAIEAVIRNDERRVVSFFDAVRVRYVKPAEIAQLDPDLASFRNVNTPQEWQAARTDAQSWTS